MCPYVHTQTYLYTYDSIMQNIYRYIYTIPGLFTAPRRNPDAFTLYVTVTIVVGSVQGYIYIYISYIYALPSHCAKKKGILLRTSVLGTPRPVYIPLLGHVSMESPMPVNGRPMFFVCYA